MSFRSFLIIYSHNPEIFYIVKDFLSVYHRLEFQEKCIFFLDAISIVNQMKNLQNKYFMLGNLEIKYGQMIENHISAFDCYIFYNSLLRKYLKD